MKTLITASILFSVSVLHAQNIWQPAPPHKQIPIWPGAVPDARATNGPETAKSIGVDEYVAGMPWLDVERVAQPTMTVYSPQGKNTGAAVIVFPGGGYEILDHCKAKLGIGHKQVTPDGQFSIEEVECIGACCWAPAMQVNYDFHDDLTPAKVDEILAQYAARGPVDTGKDSR